MARTLLALTLAAAFLLVAPPAGAQTAPAPTAAPAPPTPVEAARTAERNLDSWRTADARTALTSVSAQAGSNVDVAIALGRLLEQEKKYTESAETLRKAVALAPADPRPSHWLGETLLRARKTSEADTAFRKAAELATKAAEARPADAAAVLAQGAALSRRRRHAEAKRAHGEAGEPDGGGGAACGGRADPKPAETSRDQPRPAETNRDQPG